MISERRGSLRIAGLIAVALLIPIVALALHPHVGGHAAPHVILEQMDGLGMRDRLVHGTLILMFGALLAGFANYALHRGLTRLPVLLGMVSFAIGVAGVFAAGLIDGFLVPEIAVRFAHAAASAQDAALVTLTACGAAVNVLTTFGFIATAIAIGAWSFDLVRDPGEPRISAIVGFISAAITIVVLISRGSSIKPHALMAIVCAQGLWYMSVAVLVAREHATFPANEAV